MKKITIGCEVANDCIVTPQDFAVLLLQNPRIALIQVVNETEPIVVRTYFEDHVRLAMRRSSTLAMRCRWSASCLSDNVGNHVAPAGDWLAKVDEPPVLSCIAWFSTTFPIVPNVLR